jgi:hypothetical protein
VDGHLDRLQYCSSDDGQDASRSVQLRVEQDQVAAHPRITPAARGGAVSRRRGRTLVPIGCQQVHLRLSECTGLPATTTLELAVRRVCPSKTRANDIALHARCDEVVRTASSCTGILNIQTWRTAHIHNLRSIVPRMICIQQFGCWKAEVSSEFITTGH